MVNIAEILENAPKGIKLYSLVHGEVIFDGVIKPITDNIDISFPIVAKNCYNYEEEYTKYGTLYNTFEGTECVLFPSQEHKSWDNWQDILFQCGDVVVSQNETPVGFQVFLCYENEDRGYLTYDVWGEKNYITPSYYRYATPEERDQFMTELNANGYKWNADTKVLAEIKCPNSEYNTNIDNQVKNNTFYHIPQETEVEVTPDGCYKCVLKTEKKNPKFRIGDHIVGDDETIYKIMDAHGTLYTLYDYSNQIEFKQTINKIDENCSLVTDQELIDAGIKNQHHKFKAGDVIRNKETGIVCKINYLAKNWYIFYKNKNQSGLKYENEDKWELVTVHKTKSKRHYITPHREFFNWIYDRLVSLYGENPNIDYMLSLKERIDDLFPEKEETDTTSEPTEEKQFTIGDFKPFDRVLVRNYDVNTWSMEFFESYRFNHYYCMTDNYKQCIPYNEETKHLLCEKEDCPKKYKTWED